MKTIGLLGGMSWESSIEYYRIINQEVRVRLGGHHSARSVMVSVDFAAVEEMQAAGDWDAAGDLLARAAAGAAAAGADCLVLCTNTMHKVGPAIEAAIEIPFIHIADPTAEAIRADGLETVGLLGTNFTMTEDFYTGRLHEKGVRPMVPAPADRDTVHRIIYDELVMGTIVQQSKEAYLAVIDRLAAQGAQGVILGCTEIGLLVKEGDCALPLYDTTEIHARAAVDFALSE